MRQQKGQLRPKYINEVRRRRYTTDRTSYGCLFGKDVGKDQAKTKDKLLKRTADSRQNMRKITKLVVYFLSTSIILVASYVARINKL